MTQRVFLPVIRYVLETTLSRHFLSLEITSIGLISNNTVLQPIQLFPNPTADSINFSLTNENTTEVKVRVYDVTSRVQHHINLPKTAPTVSANIDLSASPYGLYLLDIRQGADRSIHKILRTR
jgi:hypothetical protein